MPKLSSAAWIVHDVGLATAIGGTLFGQEAFAPALREIPDEHQRDLVSEAAWNRFSWINLAGHVAMAATWFVGRSMLTGRGISRRTRPLTKAKDALVVASLVTGIASIAVGRVLGNRMSHDGRPQRDEKTETLKRTVRALSTANLAANLGVAAVTTSLSMEAAKSPSFPILSRRLP